MTTKPRCNRVVRSINYCLASRSSFSQTHSQAPYHMAISFRAAARSCCIVLRHSTMLLATCLPSNSRPTRLTRTIVVFSLPCTRNFALASGRLNNSCYSWLSIDCCLRRLRFRERRERLVEPHLTDSYKQELQAARQQAGKNLEDEKNALLGKLKQMAGQQ